jgi:6-phosphogluconolactonase (cycloisomerase 2 family)
MTQECSAPAPDWEKKQMSSKNAGNARILFLCLDGFVGLLLVAALLAASACSSGPSNPPPPPPAAVFAYTANESGSISGYSVDTSSGTLTVLSGFPMNIGGNPDFVTHDPSSHFLAVSDIAQALIHVYGINATTGALTEIAPSPYSVEQEPNAMAFDPTGKFLYIVSQKMNSVTAFTLNSSGVLSPIAGSPFPTGGTLALGETALVDPSGKFFYMADIYNVYSFQINASSGALTLVSTVAGPNIAGGMALDPSGSLLYVVGSGSNSILSYSINSSTGALTAGPSSPLALQDGAYTIAIDPAGNFAYTVENSQYLVAYSLTNGTFSAIGNYSGALGTQQLTIDSSGSFLYAPQAGTDNDVNAFRIGSSGTLSTIGSPAPAVQWPMSMTLVRE